MVVDQRKSRATIASDVLCVLLQYTIILSHILVSDNELVFATTDNIFHYFQYMDHIHGVQQSLSAMAK